MSKYKFDENYFESIDNEHKAYWLGFLFADGCILEMISGGIKVPATIQISLSTVDIEIIEKFMQDIKLCKKIYFGEATCKNGKKPYCRIQVGSRKMCNDLVSYGCTPRKSQTLQFPIDYIPSDLIKHFIRGYFDGNGSVYFVERMNFDKRRNKSYLTQSFCCNFQGTKAFLTEVEKILNRNCIITRPIRQGHGNVFSLDFGRRDAVYNFFHYIYDDCTIYLSRKYDKFIKTFEYLDIIYD